MQFIVTCNAQLALETESRRLDPERLSKGVRAVLNDASKGTYFIAEYDGVAVGQLLVTFEWSDWRNGNFWWIQSVYVIEPFRGRRIFRALFEHVRDLARARPDVCGLRLYVDSENTRARQVYGRLGMVSCRYEMLEKDFVLTHD